MKLNSFNLGNRIKLMQFCAVLAAATWGQAAFADGRVVLVGPNDQGPVHLGPNEKVTHVQTATIAGQKHTILQTGPMGPKPKFVIGMPLPFPPGAMVFFPFPPDRDEPGVHFSYDHHPGPGGTTDVVLSRSLTGDHPGHGEDAPMRFPPGSIIIPDPPQPPGLTFMADRYPADPATESAVLAALGLPDNPWPEVWVLTTGDLYFYTDNNPPGPPVHVSPPVEPGDLNCDGVVDLLDVDLFAQALIDPAAYDAANPNCGYFYADVNHDAAVNALDIAPFIALLMGA